MQLLLGTEQQHALQSKLGFCYEKDPVNILKRVRERVCCYWCCPNSCCCCCKLLFFFSFSLCRYLCSECGSGMFISVFSLAASAQPDRTFHNFRSSKSTDRRVMCISETSTCDSKIVKYSVGSRMRRETAVCSRRAAGKKLKSSKGPPGKAYTMQRPKFKRSCHRRCSKNVIRKFRCWELAIFLGKHTWKKNSN